MNMKPFEFKHTKFVCTRCGADEIHADAVVRWNTLYQEWALVATDLKTLRCAICGAEEYEEQEV